ncbi:MAG: hypothetical protein M3042_08525 [Actinomycetota bacterium]|nr:hypothetical protein [Actinomycetota bacterium]
MKAVVTAEWTAAGHDRLAALGYQVQAAGWGTTRRQLPPGELVAIAADADLLVVEVEAVDAAVLAGLPALRLLGTARGTPSNVDIAACTLRGVPVLCTPARNADSVADFVIGQILSLCRGIAAGERHLRDEGWLVGGELPYLHFRGPELSGLTLGLVGYGAVGRAVARRAGDGFGMRVAYFDPYVEGSVPLAELLAGSDVVSLHCSRGPATDRLIGAAELAAMRPSAYLINTAGGRVVDEAALVDCLSRGGIAGAALDVFAAEPLPAGSLLRHLDNVLLTPHLAGAAWDVVRHHTDLLCDDIERWHQGVTPRRCANPEVLQ